MFQVSQDSVAAVEEAVEVVTEGDAIGVLGIVLILILIVGVFYFTVIKKRMAGKS